MLDALHHFLLIAEHGTFTEAARRAHLSQPALTATVHKLESHFGARLFHRGRRGATLTAAGAALLPRIQTALATLEDARRAITELEGLHAGEVRIGAGATACTYLLPSVLARFRREYPGVRFRLSEMTTDEARNALHDGDIDLAVVSEADPTVDAMLRTELWFIDQLILVGAPGCDPKTSPFLTFRNGTTSRTLFDRHFPEADVVMELGSIAAIKGNVRAGIGLALVSRHAVLEDLSRGKMVEVKHRKTPIVRQFRIIHPGTDRLPPAAAAFRTKLLAAKQVASSKR